MLTDRFSPSQLPDGFDGTLLVRPSSAAEARAMLQAAGSAVADKTLASALGAHLGVSVPVNRERVGLHPEDQIVLAEYRGPRLAPGQAHMPDGARFDFFLIEVGVPTGWTHKKT